MTYQSFPNRPIIFPDQAVNLNQFGVQPLKGNYVRHEQLLPAGDPEYSSWRSDAHRMALARVQNSKDAEHKMLKGPPSVKGARPYLTKRYQFDKPMQGGVAKTSEGERMVSDLVKDRIQQYNAIASASFDTVGPERLAAITPQTDSFALDSLFSSLLSSVNEGLITKALIATMNTITNTIATSGDKLGSDKLAQYSQILADLSRATHDAVSRSGMLESAEHKKLLLSIILSSKRLFDFIKKLQAYSGAPSRTRAIALAGERAKMLEQARLALTTSVTQSGPAIAPDWESRLGSGYRRRF